MTCCLQVHLVMGRTHGIIITWVQQVSAYMETARYCLHAWSATHTHVSDCISGLKQV